MSALAATGIVAAGAYAAARLPSVEQVVKDMSGEGPRDSDARAAAALMWMTSAARVENDQAQAALYEKARLRIEAGENARARSNPYAQFDQTFGRCLRLYTFTDQFVREVLDRYFSPSWLVQHPNGGGTVWRDAVALPARRAGAAPFPSPAYCSEGAARADLASIDTHAGERDKVAPPANWTAELPTVEQVRLKTAPGVDAADTTTRQESACEVVQDLIEVLTEKDEYRLAQMPPEARARWGQYRVVWTNHRGSSTDLAKYAFSNDFRREVIAKYFSKGVQDAYWSVRSVVRFGSTLPPPADATPLAQMPSVASVLKTLTPAQSASLIDASMKQASTFNRLAQIVRTRSGTVAATSALTKDEAALAAAYDCASLEADARGQFLLALREGAGRPDDAYAKLWFKERAPYDDRINPVAGTVGRSEPFVTPGNAAWNAAQAYRVRLTAIEAADATSRGPRAWTPASFDPAVDRARRAAPPVDLSVFETFLLGRPLISFKPCFVLGLVEGRASGCWSSPDASGPLTQTPPPMLVDPSYLDVLASGKPSSVSLWGPKPSWVAFSEGVVERSVLVAVNIGAGEGAKEQVASLQAKYGEPRVSQRGRVLDWSRPGLHVRYTSKDPPPEPIHLIVTYENPDGSFTRRREVRENPAKYAWAREVNLVLEIDTRSGSTAAPAARSEVDGPRL